MNHLSDIAVGIIGVLSIIGAVAMFAAFIGACAFALPVIAITLGVA